MRKILFLLMAYCTVSSVRSQNVGIGTTIPHQSSVLHLHSTTRGFLPPRMTTTQRQNIVNPLNGLMVYDTDAERIYVHTDGDWKFLLNNDYWARSATRNFVYNGSDSIGIGTAAPSARLHVNGMLRVSNSELMLTNSDLTINKTDGIIQFQGSGNNLGFVQLSGNNLRLGTNSGNTTGNVVIRMDGSDRVFIDETGRVGLNMQPGRRLDVSGDIGATGNGIFGNNLTVGNNLSVNSSLTVGNNITIDAGSRVISPIIPAGRSLLPTAYGRVQFMALSYSGTTNVTVTRISQGVYHLTSPQFHPNTCITVTLNEYPGGFFATPLVQYVSTTNTYKVTFYAMAPAPDVELLDAGFSFIAFN